LNFSYPAISSAESSLESMLARAVGARLEFELGDLDLAKSLKFEIEKEIQSMKSSNPGNDFSRIIAQLDY